jgi:hypothetical protein
VRLTLRLQRVSQLRLAASGLRWRQKRALCLRRTSHRYAACLQHTHAPRLARHRRLAEQECALRPQRKHQWHAAACLQ